MPHQPGDRVRVRVRPVGQVGLASIRRPRRGPSPGSSRTRRRAILRCPRRLPGSESMPRASARPPSMVGARPACRIWVSGGAALLRLSMVGARPACRIWVSGGAALLRFSMVGARPACRIWVSGGAALLRFSMVGARPACRIWVSEGLRSSGFPWSVLAPPAGSGCREGLRSSGPGRCSPRLRSRPVSTGRAGRVQDDAREPGPVGDPPRRLPRMAA